MLVDEQQQLVVGSGLASDRTGRWHRHAERQRQYTTGRTNGDRERERQLADGDAGRGAGPSTGLRLCTVTRQPVISVRGRKRDDDPPDQSRMWVDGVGQRVVDHVPESEWDW